MQSKAIAEGAVTAKFVDVSGMSSQNQVSALDVARLANAAFSTELVRGISRTQSFRLCSTVGNCKYIKNTNQLLSDKDLTTIAGKTGTLDGAINFAGSFRDSRGHYFIVVILGAETKAERFVEAKELVKFASERAFWQDLFSLK
jgi:D-alanyl-D-alanine carboxypeptidase